MHIIQQNRGRNFTRGIPIQKGRAEGARRKFRKNPKMRFIIMFVTAVCVLLATMAKEKEHFLGLRGRNFGPKKRGREPCR